MTGTMGITLNAGVHLRRLLKALESRTERCPRRM